MLLCFDRTISQQFGVSMSTAHDSLTQVVNAVLANMNIIIKMPSTEQKFRALADKFYTYKHPNVVGAIDGTSIEVAVPNDQRLDYFTRKYITAVNLTAVCDSDKRYLNINVGYSASLS